MKITNERKNECRYFIVTVARIEGGRGASLPATYGDVNVHINEWIHRIAADDWNEVDRKIRELYVGHRFVLMPFGGDSPHALMMLAPEGSNISEVAMALIADQIIAESQAVGNGESVPAVTVPTSGADSVSDEEEWPDIIG